jgi:thioredoxin-dependent peroxiredoxin
MMKQRMAAAGGMLALLAAGCFLAGCTNLAAVHEEAAAARSPITGLPAPDFALKDQDSRRVTLSGLRGQWVVLYFYPKDDTPGCTCEATEFTGLLARFRQMNAQVYGISADTPTSHKLFIAYYNLGLNLLSDPDHAVMKSYGAWVAAALGDKAYERVIRSTFIIDPQGIVRYHWPEVIPQGHADRVRQKLEQLQAAPKPK